MYRIKMDGKRFWGTNHTWFYPLLSIVLYTTDSFWYSGFPGAILVGLIIAFIGCVLWDFFYEKRKIRWYPWVHEGFFLFLFFVLPFWISRRG